MDGRSDAQEGDADIFGAPQVQAPWLPDSPSGGPAQAASAEQLLEGLNPAQREACLHGEGPLLILAGPGSGKTRVITHRIAHLVSVRGVDPRAVIAITFTNKAAREMRERVERLLPGVSGLWISTFHAACARILRRDIESLGRWTRDFTIYDTAERNALLRDLVKELGYDPQRFRAPVLGGWISRLKNSAAQEDAHAAEQAMDGMESEVFAKVRRRYEEAMGERNALDFDDLLLKVLELFDQHPGVRDLYAQRFRYVLVDEYQDTNRVQYRLVQHLAARHGNLAVCGDPDQSIYRWRGADIRNILDFEKDFENPVTVRLEQNYRSTGNILAAASAVIAHNTERKHKDLWCEEGDGEKLVVLECADEDDEAREIAAQCATLRARGEDLAQVAIFYRMNFMQRALETALRLSGLPYQVVAGLEFYQRREIKDLIAYLRLLVNPADDGAFLRVVNEPTRGVGARSLEKLRAWASARREPLLAAAGDGEALAQIRGRAKKGLASFAALMDELLAVRDADAAVALDLVLQTIEADRWMAAMDDGGGTAEREANVEELRSHAAEFDRLYPGAGLRGFLEEVALVSDADGAEEAGGSIKLMTLHAAKGLEFATVFISGCEDGLLPHARAVEEDPLHGIEEERRLFYVGMTRARRRLFLTRAMTRTFFGESRWNESSPFLDEIPPGLVEGAMTAPEEEERDVLGEYDPEGAQALAVGALVEHDHFGVGTVEQLAGAGINARATVRFRGGVKQLLLQYANLRVLS